MVRAVCILAFLSKRLQTMLLYCISNADFFSAGAQEVKPSTGSRAAKPVTRMSSLTGKLCKQNDQIYYFSIAIDMAVSSKATTQQLQCKQILGGRPSTQWWQVKTFWVADSWVSSNLGTLSTKRNDLVAIVCSHLTFSLWVWSLFYEPNFQWFWQWN